MSADAGGGEGREDAGPVPVRDLLRQTGPDTSQDGEDSPPDGSEIRFDMDDATWVARVAGAAAYGTGRTGLARLLAVQFFRASEPDTPVREALVPAGRFPHLRAEELRTLFDAATPMAVKPEE